MCAEHNLEEPQMLTRSRSRRLQEQSRDREAPAGERNPERSVLISNFEVEFGGIDAILRSRFESIRQRAGVTDEPLINPEPEVPDQLEVRRKEFRLEELLGTFEELGLVFGEIVKGFFDTNFEVMLQVINNIGSLVTFYVIPRKYPVKISKEGLIRFLKAILIAIAIEILIVFPDYYFSTICILVFELAISMNDFGLNGGKRRNMNQSTWLQIQALRQVRNRMDNWVCNLGSRHACNRGTATAGSDVVQSGRPIFGDFPHHLWPYIGNNTANVVFQMVKRLWLIRIDQ
ncbi:hypothetical protein TNCV_4329801 [Trichonephila clavipes]|nr:hypothetical protein TNCV_4329801 [Trichonephila clavipes]